MPKPLYTDDDLKRDSGAPSKKEQEHGRSPFRKDYARLLHAPSFRRLQGKTQLFPGSESDYFRNRLTHSLEVAQIAAGIAEALNATCPELESNPIDTDLVQFAAIAHDLGHPPFGHNGEHALDELMREYGGFEGNAQTLRILTSTEKKAVKIGEKFSHNFGLDLTYRTLASVLKYDNIIKEVRKPSASLSKGYYRTEKEIVAKIKEHVAPGYAGKFKTIECSIMDLADDIAYSTYDLEDSLHAGFVSPISLLQALLQDKVVRDEVLRKTNDALIEQEYGKIDEREMVKHAMKIFDLSSLADDDEDKKIKDPLIKLGYKAVKFKKADELITKDAVLRTKFTANRIGELINAAKLIYNPDYPALSKVALSREKLLDVEILKHLNFELVIRSPRLAIVEYRGKDIVKDLFKAIISSSGDLLSGAWKVSYKEASTKHEKYRVTCEFISGMTDNYAVEFHNSLFGNGKNLYKPV
jgi:dGTPase